MFYCEVTAADKATVGGGVDGKSTSNIVIHKEHCQTSFVPYQTANEFKRMNEGAYLQV